MSNKSTNLKHYLNKWNFIDWMNSISKDDSDPYIRLYASEIGFEVNGNCNISKNPRYEILYKKYNFKVITKNVDGSTKVLLYYYDGVNTEFIGLIQGSSSGAEQRCCIVTMMPPTPSVTTTPTPTISATITPTPTKTVTKTPTVTPSVSITTSATPSISVSPSVTVTPSISVSPTVTPSISVSPTVTPSISISPTVTPSITISPSITPSITITPSPTSSNQCIVNCHMNNVWYYVYNPNSCISPQARCQSICDYLWGLSVGQSVNIDNEATCFINTDNFNAIGSGTILLFTDSCLQGRSYTITLINKITRTCIVDQTIKFFTVTRVT